MKGKIYSGNSNSWNLQVVKGLEYIGNTCNWPLANSNAPHRGKDTQSVAVISITRQGFVTTLDLLVECIIYCNFYGPKNSFSMCQDNLSFQERIMSGSFSIIYPIYTPLCPLTGRVFCCILVFCYNFDTLLHM